MQNEEKTIAVYLYNISSRYVGIGEVEHHLALGLSAQADRLYSRYGIRFLFIVPPGFKGYYGDQVDYFTVSLLERFLFRHEFFAFLSRWLFPHIDLLHLTHQISRIKYKISDKRLMTFHDINFMYCQLSQKKLEHKMYKTNRSIRLATHLSFITNFVQQDVNHHFDLGTRPQRVVVNGVTDLSGVQGKKPCGLPDHFMLHLSSLCNHKNVELLIRMMQYLPNENLVIAGKGKEKDVVRLRGVAEGLHLKNVYYVGLVPEPEKAWLFQHCKAFLFPSLNEGFGLPVIEAMYCSKPVFITRLTSLPEVGGDVACYFDDLSPHSMADVVTKGMADFEADSAERGRQLRLRAEQFTWDKCVQNYVDYYLDILGLCS